MNETVSSDSIDLADLLHRVRRLEEVEKLREMRPRFALCGDPETRIEPLLELLTDDFVAEYTGGFGRAEGKEGIRKLLEVDPVNCRHHMFVPVWIEVDDDLTNARAKWYLLETAKCQIEGTDENVPVWIAAVLDDVYVKEDGKWKFKSFVTDLRLFCRHDEGWAVPVDVGQFMSNPIDAR